MDRRFVSQVCPACFPAKISKWILLLCCSCSSCCYSWFSNKTEDANKKKRKKNCEATRMLFSNAKKKYFIDFRNQRNDFWKMFYFVAVAVDVVVVVAVIACRIKM